MKKIDFITHGATLIGAPWSGKTTIGRAAAKKLEAILTTINVFGDMDEHMESKDGWGKGGVAKKLQELGDDGFIDAEGRFAIERYGYSWEGAKIPLNTMLLGATGSLPLNKKAMDHVASKSTVIHIDVPISVLEKRALPGGREDGNTRIVGMNGENPRFKTLRETLEYRGDIYVSSRHFSLPYKDEPMMDTVDRLVELILNAR